jgi:hypothetical protein
MAEWFGSVTGVMRRAPFVPATGMNAGVNTCIAGMAARTKEFLNEALVLNGLIHAANDYLEKGRQMPCGEKDRLSAAIYEALLEHTQLANQIVDLVGSGRPRGAFHSLLLDIAAATRKHELLLDQLVRHKGEHGC